MTKKGEFCLGPVGDPLSRAPRAAERRDTFPPISSEKKSFMRTEKSAQGKEEISISYPGPSCSVARASNNPRQSEIFVPSIQNLRFSNATT